MAEIGPLPPNPLPPNPALPQAASQDLASGDELSSAMLSTILHKAYEQGLTMPVSARLEALLRQLD